MQMLILGMLVSWLCLCFILTLKASWPKRCVQQVQAQPNFAAIHPRQGTVMPELVSTLVALTPVASTAEAT